MAKKSKTSMELAWAKAQKEKQRKSDAKKKADFNKRQAALNKSKKKGNK